MAVSLRELNRSTMARQLLLRRTPLGVTEAVRRLVGVQAQEPASPYIALWNRLEGFDGAALDAAFVSGEVVRASVVRLTLHAVASADHAEFHAAVLPYLRASRLNDARFTSEGLTTAEADALVPGLLQLATEPRSKAELEAYCGSSRMWWALRTFAPLVHVPAGAPWAFGPRPRYVAASGAQTVDVDVEAARAVLVRRYLKGFGPASMADIGTFTFLRRPAVRQAIATLGDGVVVLEGPDGAELFDVPGGVVPPARTPAPPRLLGMWDNVLLAYDDRRRIVPDAYRPLVIRRNGDVLPTMLVDGHVAGVWRSRERSIEMTAFHELSATAWRAVSVQARQLGRLLAGRDPRVYRRYDHWWDDLPAVEVRTVDTG